jgi:hypothetical protein
MDLLPFFEWIQNSSVGTAIRDSLVVFPVVETLHVVGLSISVGLILITDLRLTGVALSFERPSAVMRPLRMWMLSGFALMFTTGALLFWAEAAKCYKSPAFRLKMIFLLLAGLNALLFETSLGRTAGAWDDDTVPPPRARLAGWMSLLCWSGVVIFGRWTAYGLN